MLEKSLIIIVLLPLFASIIVGLRTQKIQSGTAVFITVSSVLTAAFLSIYVLISTTLSGNTDVIVIELLRWIDVGNLQAAWSIRSDSLTNIMLVVVTVVSSLVHIYSVGYMSHDPHLPRFMSYLSLFTFCMLMLVTANDFIQLFFGWEGVGLASYLLIGFWYKKPTAKAAAMKAFIVNRVGDFGLSLGIFAIFMVFGTVSYPEVFAQVSTMNEEVISFMGTEYHAITVICVLLFIGAMGKSAQLGLHTWLPDAMEGPTPVSALIHAATMVTAGVFLVARCSYLFEYSDVARDMVTLVGAITCVFAASIALTQNDIKKIIAYSTCSQLGYMFFALGVSAYSAGVFHLMTHAFFKALLFLCAGSVIHAMSDEQDIRRMGGIWKHIKVTYVLMFIGSLAIAGIPPFAGFYSKDIVLEAAYASPSAFGEFAYWMGIIAAFMTAFYSWRLLLLTFHGKPRAEQKVMSHIHESPKVMLIPLYVLGIGAIFSGFYGYHVGMVGDMGEFWGNAIFVLGADNPETNPLTLAHQVPAYIKYMPLMVGLVAIMLAYILYYFKTDLPAKIASILKPLYTVSHHKYYIDELYNYLLVKPSLKLGTFFWKLIDKIMIDDLGPNGSARVTQTFSAILSKLQTGYVYHYIFIMMIGITVFLAWYVF